MPNGEDDAASIRATRRQHNSRAKHIECADVMKTEYRNEATVKVAQMIFAAIACSTLTVLAQTLPEPDNAFVRIVPDRPSAARLWGEGVPAAGAAAPAVDSQGRDVVWREIRRDTDERGGTHVFYRQFLTDHGTPIELFGSEIGVHYKNGRAWIISGRQFVSAAVTNRVLFTPDEAVDRAVARLAESGFRVQQDADPYAPSHGTRAAHTVAKLVSVAGSMRYAYFTSARSDEGKEHNVIIDAENGAIFAVTPVDLASNCQPSSPLQNTSATGVPVRTDLRGTVLRTLAANRVTDRPAYSYEGFYSGSPKISVVQETTTVAMACGGAARAYTLFPLKTTVYQDDASAPEWQGYKAGDALYHTKQTMLALSSLGRNSWNGQGGDANVAIESTFNGGSPDNAYFTMNGTGDPRIPPTPTLYIPQSSHYYHPAAALDVIGHEWGHGVIFTSANFPTTTDVGLQLHEGWADVVGQAVEKLRQPKSADGRGGIEKSDDWTIHEDNATSGYARGALDDGDAPGHPFVGLAGYTLYMNQMIHRQEISTNATYQLRGNMMNMVFKLLSDSGSNPICSRHPEYQGCGTVTSGLGKSVASKLLFDTLQYYLPSTAQWADLANYAMEAAYDLYATCPNYGATIEQTAVQNAFRSIGYPATWEPFTCPP